MTSPLRVVPGRPTFVTSRRPRHRPSRSPQPSSTAAAAERVLTDRLAAREAIGYNPNSMPITTMAGTVMPATSLLGLHQATPLELLDRIAAERRGDPFVLYRDGSGRQRLIPLGAECD